MKYIFNVSPNLRQKQSTQKIMLELTIALLIVFGFSLAYYFQAYGMDYVIRATCFNGMFGFDSTCNGGGICLLHEKRCKI